MVGGKKYHAGIFYILVDKKTRILLQFNNLKVDQRKKSCIRVNIRELNGVLGTIYLLIYTN